MNFEHMTQPVSPYPEQFVKQEAISGMTEREPNVTAKGVLANAQQPQSFAAFTARGGVRGTVDDAVNARLKQQRFRQQQRVFENLLEQKQKGAQDAYNQAITAEPRLKEWIPIPELFVDEKTGGFMALKYYEAFYRGLQKLSKSEADAAKVQREKGKELREEKRIATSERRANITEQGLRETQKRTGLLEQEARLKERRFAADEVEKKSKEKKDREASAYKVYRDAVMREQQVTKMKTSVGYMPGSEQAKEIDKQGREAESAKKSALMDYMKIINEGKSPEDQLSQEALVKSVDIENWTINKEMPQYIVDFLNNNGGIAKELDDVDKTEKYTPEEENLFALSKFYRTPWTIDHIRGFLSKGKTSAEIIQALILSKNKAPQVKTENITEFQYGKQPEPAPQKPPLGPIR